MKTMYACLSCDQFMSVLLLVVVKCALACTSCEGAHAVDPLVGRLA